ncbi:hypothetical protein [Massilia putida]|uniref:hypothetical protein n=1 Tax=Massilia putida TaxID=1141883 RepID=UPI000950BAF3|nr:hypothetical protein [Massilia putida]
MSVIRPVLLLCALLAGCLRAAHADEPVPSVHVAGITNPEMRSYRSVAAGLDAFDANRALAPNATLRFRMRHADGAPADAGEGLQLRLASDDGSFQENVPIDAAGLLAVARNQAAYDADATFILNRKNGLYTAHPEVRTAGLPDNVRRLGDLRLECRVTIAIFKEQIPFLAKATLNTLMLTSDWCAKKDFNYGAIALRKGVRAVLRDGERVRALETHGWNAMVPIGDTAWPDDAIVQFDDGTSENVTRTADGTPRTAP